MSPYSSVYFVICLQLISDHYRRKFNSLTPLIFYISCFAVVFPARFEPRATLLQLRQMDFSRKTKIVVELGLCVASEVARSGFFLQRFARVAGEY